MAVRFTSLSAFFAGLLLAGSVCAQASPATQAAGNPEAGRIKSTTCTGCHGIPGYVNIYPTYRVPKVAGQHYQVLVTALEAYRAGKRDHPTMHAQAGSLTDQDIADIAAYFSSLDPLAGEFEVEAAAGGQLAEKLCMSCHGKGGLSENSLYPILAGQYSDYLLQALKDYKSGERQNIIMGGLVGTLSLEDMETLADYYAAQSYLKTLEVAED